MDDPDALLHAMAGTQRRLITRAQALCAGLTDRQLESRLAHAFMVAVHPGVYLLGPGPMEWECQVHAAVLAAGPDAAASHRAALLLWGLDGIGNAPIEVSAPISDRPVPRGVIVHRTRRPLEIHIRRNVPVTSVERTLLDVGAVIPEANVEMAAESAYRLGLTTPTKTRLFLDQTGARGVPGAGKLRHILDVRYPGRAAGSAGEVKLIRLLRDCGIEDPERQFEIWLPDHTKAVVDLAWPRRMVLVERDSVESRAGARELHYLLRRQNALLELGYELRRYDWVYVNRHANLVARELLPLLRRHPPVL